MPAKSSSNHATELSAVKAALAETTPRWQGRFLLLALNFLPLAHVLLTSIVLCLTGATWPGRLGLSLAVLYLSPPLVARLILLLAPICEGRVAVGGAAFFGWWTLFQLQVVFCRLPALEEALRLVPGLYSLWLRLWGARIGRLTYWSPGTMITDRSFLAIGDDVVFGAGVRLNAHVLARARDGRLELLLGTIKIGDRATVGGYSLLTAGTEISVDENSRACLVSPPFSVWQDGRRVKPSPTIE